MRHLFLLCFALLATYPAAAQYATLDSLCQVYQLPAGKDTLTYVIFGSKAELAKKKPLFFFRQGSQPRPLIDYDRGRYYLGGPFKFREYVRDYHFVIVSKHGVPLVADSTFRAGYDRAMRGQDSSGTYITRRYQQTNYRERYVDDCNRVINRLVKQPFVDAQKVVYFGGSEGFTVGADLVANHNRYVTHTILVSGHAGRRIENLIYATRQQMETGELSPEDGQKMLDSIYAYWKGIVANPTSTTQLIGDTYRAQYSFSEPNLTNLLKIKTPLYIAYGSTDNEIAEQLDYLPLEFIAHGKTNLTLRRHFDHNHQFFRLVRDAKDNVVGKEYNGDAVAKEWFDWLKAFPIK